MRCEVGQALDSAETFMLFMIDYSARVVVTKFGCMMKDTPWMLQFTRCLLTCMLFDMHSTVAGRGYVQEIVMKEYLHLFTFITCP